MRPELLLHPNIPKPLHGMSPRELKGDDWWNQKRQEAYKNADYRCQCCGVHKNKAKYHRWLEAHECYEYDYENGIATVSEIVALCHSCHNYIHSGRMLVLLERGDMSESKYNDIRAHGDAILAAGGLKRRPPPQKVCDWSKWKIVIDGIEYPTKFKSFDEWKSYYRR